MRKFNEDMKKENVINPNFIVKSLQYSIYFLIKFLALKLKVYLNAEACILHNYFLALL